MSDVSASSRSVHARRAAAVALAAVLALVAGLYVHALLVADVNPDAGTYVASARRMAEGEVLYRDLGLAYTPVAIALLAAVPLVLGGGAPYAAYLGVSIAVCLLVVAMTGLVARRAGCRPLGALFAAASAGVLLYDFETAYVVLEPFVALFALFAVWAAMGAPRRRGLWLVAGAAAASAAMTKQYGLAVLPALGLHALLAEPTGRSRLVALGLGAAGFGLVLAAFFGLYAVAFGVAPAAILAQWRGGNYPWWGLGPAAATVKRFLVLRHFHLLGLGLVLAHTPSRRDPRLWLVLACALLFLSPLLVRVYGHYLVLSIPFFSVLGGLVVSRAVERPRAGAVVLLLAAFALGSNTHRAIRDLRKHDRQWDRPAQVAATAALEAEVPAGEPLIVLGDADQWLQALGDWRPAAPRTLGHMFSVGLTPEERDEALGRGVAVVSRPEVLAALPTWRDALARHGYAPTPTPTDFVVWLP